MSRELIEKLLSKLPAKNPRLVLRDLSEKVLTRGEFKLELCPLVTLYSRHGHLHHGRLVGRTSDKDGYESFILAGYLVNTPLPSEVIYVDGESIVAVNVHSFESEVSQLTSGTISHRPNEEAPSRLALKRFTESLNENKKKQGKIFPSIMVDWNSLPENSAAYLNLKDLVEVLVQTLNKIAVDKLGKSALASIEVIEISHEANLPITVKKVQGGLALDLDFTHSLHSSLGEKLEASINTVL
ncbi:MAG: hypothetical protein FJ116_11790 [Deltaproteobacteria bacterium]|nr:hypothetical protein [Deltaproteobacteria bacterium]